MAQTNNAIPIEQQATPIFAECAKDLHALGFLPIPLEAKNPKKPAIRYKAIARKGNKGQ